MLRVIYRKKGLKIASIWFAPSRSKMLEQNCDIAFYHQMLDAKQNKYDVETINTLTTDLLSSHENIMSNIDKKVRYEIRRAINDGIETVFYNSQDLFENDKIVVRFCEQYNQFIKSKHLPGKCNIAAIHAHMEEKSFFLSCSRYNGEYLVFHAYVADGNVARLWYSSSLFRNLNDKHFKAIIGRANRLLHWNDILFFKSLGFKTYDWGGYSESHNVSRISKFKKDFGGNKAEMYNCHIPCSSLGFIVLNAIHVLNSLKKTIGYLKNMINKKGIISDE